MEEKKNFGQKMKEKAVGNLEYLEKVLIMIETFLENKLGLKKNRKVTICMLAGFVVVFASIDINIEAFIAGGVVLGLLMLKDKVLSVLKKEETVSNVEDKELEESSDQEKESKEKEQK